MKFSTILVLSLMLTLGVGHYPDTFAQTSQDLQINDTASDYQLGYQAGQEAAKNGVSTKPTGNNSQAYLDGYRAGFASRSELRNQLTIEVDSEQTCPNQSDADIPMGGRDSTVNDGVGVNIDLSTGQTNCQTKK